MLNRNDENLLQNLMAGRCETKEVIFHNYEKIKTEVLTIDLCNTGTAHKNGSNLYNQHNGSLRSIIFIIIILIFYNMVETSHKYRSYS